MAVDATAGVANVGEAPPPQTPATTVVQDVVYRASGTPAQGVLLISWPAFVTADHKAVAAGSMSVTLGAGGALSLALIPNQGGTPAGTYYKVLLKLDDGTTNTEYWSVPTTSPTTVSAVRTTLSPQGATQTATSSGGNWATMQYVDTQDATRQPLLGFTPENVAKKGQTNGYAGLDSAGKVPSAQLPPAAGVDGQAIHPSDVVASGPWKDARAYAVGSTTAGINEAIADFGAAPLCGTVFLAPASVTITASIDIHNRSGCILQGWGDGQSPPTRLVWGGTVGGTMLTMSGSDSARIRNIYFNCANSAATAMDADSSGTPTQQGEISGNTFAVCSGAALHIGSAADHQVSEISVHDNVFQGSATAIYQDGAQTQNIHYLRNSFFNWTNWAMDFAGGAADVRNTDLQSGTATVGGGIKVRPTAQAMIFDWIYGDGAQVNTTPFLSFPAGVRNFTTTLTNSYLNWQVTGGRIIDFEQTNPIAISNTQFINDGTGSGEIHIANSGGGSGGVVEFRNNTLASGHTLGITGFALEDSSSSCIPWNSNLGCLTIKGTHTLLMGGGLTFGTSSAEHFTLTDDSGTLTWSLTQASPGSRVFSNFGPYGLETTAYGFNTGFFRAGDATKGYQLGATGPFWSSGAGSPEGAVTAPVGSTYSRTDGGASTSLYVKEPGAGGTGWVALQPSLGFTPENAASKGQANGYAALDADGQVPLGQIPALSESQITGLAADLDGKAASTHTHAEDDITGLVADLAARLPLSSFTRAGVVALWTSCTSGYLKYDGTCDTPSAGGAAWGSISGTLANQTDLDTALAGKAASSHTHAESDVTSLVTDLAAKVPTSRTVNGHALSADVSVTKSDVGLGNADNTSDASKPVSTATQTALDAKVSIVGAVRQMCYLAGANNASAVLVDADDQPEFWFNLTGRTQRVTAASCKADLDNSGANKPRIQITNGANNVFSDNGNAGCDCAAASATACTINATYQDVTANTAVGFTLVTAGGYAKRVTVCLQLTAQ